MINIKLASLLKKIDKNVAEAARETKLNRNTIMWLTQGRVDGLKFTTLNKLCATYHWKIEDLLEFHPDPLPPSQNAIKEVYRQEGEGTAFFLWPGLSVCGQFDSNFFNRAYARVDFFLKDDYFFVYFDKNDLHDLAAETYRTLTSNDIGSEVYRAFLNNSQKIIDYYKTVKIEALSGLNDEELLKLAQDIIAAQIAVWRDSVFIDAFDAGFDQEEIKRLADSSGLSSPEVNILLTPRELTFNNSRRLVLLRLARSLRRLTPRSARQKLEKNPDALRALEDFNYYQSNYARANEVKRSDLIASVLAALKNKKLLEQEYQELQNFPQNQDRKIRAILRKHHRPENPLAFFQRLTYWREQRKMLTLMCDNLLDLLLNVVEKRTGIAKKYLKMLTGDELKLVMVGALGQEQLAKRREQGFLISVRPEGYKIFYGRQALSLKNDWEQKLQNSHKGITIIYGQVAAQGYASGSAKIILGENDFAKFKEGDILITGMTRPEFLPLMKKAKAIVTNEGGITCHAAIISRELGKPCIIGTKIATKLIKDGDLIEVRANHGTVRIIERAKEAKSGR